MFLLRDCWGDRWAWALAVRVVTGANRTAHVPHLVTGVKEPRRCWLSYVCLMGAVGVEVWGPVVRSDDAAGFGLSGRWLGWLVGCVIYATGYGEFGCAVASDRDWGL